MSPRFWGGTTTVRRLWRRHILLAAAGEDDYLDGGEGRDYIVRRPGNDIIKYDLRLPVDGDGIDFRLPSNKDLTSTTGCGTPITGLIVQNVEVLISWTMPYRYGYGWLKYGIELSGLTGTRKRWTPSDAWTQQGDAFELRDGPLPSAYGSRRNRHHDAHSSSENAVTYTHPPDRLYRAPGGCPVGPMRIPLNYNFLPDRDDGCLCWPHCRATEVVRVRSTGGGFLAWRQEVLLKKPKTEEGCCIDINPRP